MEQLQRRIPVVPTTDRRESSKTPTPSRADIVTRSAAPGRERDGAGAIKVILAGDGAVGKSTLVHRLCTGEFQARRPATIGVEFHIHNVTSGVGQTRLIVWDVSGQEQFAFARRAFYRGGKSVALVYSTGDHRSFERLAKWRTEIQEMLPNVPFVLAGNKADLPRQVTTEEGRALAAEWRIPFFETSCLFGLGVAELFEAVASAAARNGQGKSRLTAF